MRRDRGLVVLAFPSNDFGQQEPEGGQPIRQFALEKYKITFPLFRQGFCDRNQVAPLYQFLTDKQVSTDKPVLHNKKRSLRPLARSGGISLSIVLRRFEPDTEPDDPELISAIEKALSANPVW
jgi:glutathione peroxidase